MATSSISTASASITMCMGRLSRQRTSFFSIPMKVITSTLSLPLGGVGSLMVNSPSTLVVAPNAVPFTRTEAPVRGSPSWSTTFPRATVGLPFCWAACLFCCVLAFTSYFTSFPDCSRKSFVSSTIETVLFRLSAFPSRP